MKSNMANTSKLEEEEGDIMISTAPESSISRTRNTTIPSSSSNIGKYKGFSTSMSTLFHDSRDCCSIVYCGIFQWDYNYYLLKQKRPRTVGHILCIFIYIPACILFTAVACHIFLDDDKDKQALATYILLNVLLVYVLLLLLIEIRKRIKFRRELSTLLREEYSSLSLTEYDGQTNCDVCCANLCCYGVDNNFNDNQLQQEHDLCTRLFQWFNFLCCGCILQCWCQCFGSCAIAQEKREIQRLLKKREQNIDYLSYEPYSNYYPRILKVRLSKNGNLFWHIGTLSKLSKSLFKMLLCSLIGFTILAIFELTDDDFLFEFEDGGVFLLTFSQAFLILYFVHWKWNKFDLSFDAVVKYFASGFINATFTAFFFESILSYTIKLCISIIMIMFYPGEVGNGDEYNRKLESNDDYNYDNMDNTIYDDMFSTSNSSSTTTTQGEEEKDKFEKDHPGLAIVIYFINAFVVAALVEELSKYFAFSMVEHPDLVVGYNVQDDLNNQKQQHQEQTSSDHVECEEDIQAATAEVTNQIKHDTESLVNGDYNDVSWAPEKNEIERGNSSNVVTTNRPTINSNISNDRSLNSIGAGITVAMVAAAVGFACCENLIYIFIYTQDTPAVEMTVLIARSIFPVHPLCAAIQSIGVCKQRLEKKPSYKLGSIIMMPVFLHGLFDFTLMTGGVLVNVYGEESIVVIFITFFVPLATVILGFMFYFIEADAQVNRLNELDSAIIADELSDVIL